MATKKQTRITVPISSKSLNRLKTQAIENKRSVGGEAATIIETQLAKGAK